jgi:hypothetical protein
MKDKNIWWSWAFKNGIDMICWTVLAIVFHKWWIALFAALFVSSLKTNLNKCRICDNCGKHSPYADSHNEALDKAKEAGWITMRKGDKWEDYCPECQINMIGDKYKYGSTNK